MHKIIKNKHTRHLEYNNALNKTYEFITRSVFDDASRGSHDLLSEITAFNSSQSPQQNLLESIHRPKLASRE